MTFRNLMIVSFIIPFIFGTGFIIIPAQMGSIYGLSLTPAGIFMTRLLGIELGGYGLLSWLIRNAVDSELRRAILLAYFITDAIGFLVSLVVQLGGLMNPLGWSIVAIYLMFACAFGYFRFMKPAYS